MIPRPSEDDMETPMRIAEAISAKMDEVTWDSTRNVVAALLLLTSKEVIGHLVRNGSPAVRGGLESWSEVGEIVYDALAEKLDSIVDVIQAGGADGKTGIQPDSGGEAGRT